MKTYTNSKGQQVEVSSMALPHLERSLAKAIKENNQANIQTLQDEINLRKTNDSTSH